MRSSFTTPGAPVLINPCRHCDQGRYRKRYDTSEDSIHKDNYLRELEKVQEHNARDDVTWKMGINEFSDMASWQVGKLTS
mgnify:CR=1 FL=1